MGAGFITSLDQSNYRKKLKGWGVASNTGVTVLS